ncbi:MAG: NgoFVII family restriction endonuclease [Peptoniphilus sp.]|uniref:restriction endonuclease PLD domain-containing protein n=1 Tax=Peptoniphilus sp. TaxID=1971214 RepID=UPI0025D1A78A|nr:restriction endonuclease PLD domain-containing protein [Peptoniphilus sp.]MCI5642491.1 NgoFVII family restriction endonuclease [Peptoniphilus sp.]MDD7352041.1 NgoFVII family restriction endonuclease [Peptoniphilaceae bacterium]
MENNNLSFFDNDSGLKEINTIHILKDGKEEDLSIEKIFDKEKYKHFLGITYSISSKFVNEFLKEFETSEIVIGIDNDIVKNSINELAKHLKHRILEQIEGAPIKFYQELDMESKFNLDKGNLKIWVSATYIIHSKFYLMWNDKGENRVILGSANLSERAFDSKSSQFENIVIFDDSNLFNIYKKYYEENLSQVLCDYIPSELKKINSKNFKNIKNIDEINTDEIFIISNDDLGKIKEKAAVEIIDDVRNKLALGVCKDKIITDIDNISDDREVVKSEKKRENIAEDVAYEIVNEVINKRKKTPEIKSKSIITKQVKQKVEKIIVKKVEANKNIKRYGLYNRPDLRNTKNNKTGLFIISDLDKNLTIPFGKRASKEELVDALKVLNNYIKGFEKYSNRYTDDYGKRVFESLLCTFTGPFIQELRGKLEIEENRLDIPQFIIIGGDAGSGKSSLLSIMSKLTGINKGDYYQWEALLGQSLNKAKRERLDTIQNWIRENNVNPILVDEIDSDFFTKTNYGRDFIVNISNLCVRSEEPYPIFIGTTNTKSYSLPKEARRRSYYLIIDREISKNSEAKEFFKNIYENVDNTLFLDFCFRMAERLESSSDYKWDNYTEESGFDFLYNSREIFKEIYEEAEMPLPRYFPEKKYNDDSETNKENWRNLYLGSKNDFVYDDDTGHIYYNIKKLNENDKYYGTSTAQIYADALPQEVCVNSVHGAVNIGLYTDEFFDWIELKNPYKKKSFFEKIFGK